MIRERRALNVFSFAAMAKRPLILDGAMGSLLRAKHASSDSLWMSYLNIDAPEKVMNLHRKYIQAGADIITTNTFRTNPVAFESFEGKINNSLLVKKSVEIALEAADGYKVLVAGSNPPAEDCYKVERTISSKKLIANHHNHINLLIDSGVDFILNETQSHLDEIEIICKYCSENVIPFVISLYFNDDLRILSGEKMVEVISIIADYAPLAISFNCIKSELFTALLKKNKLKYNWGAYLNCGLGAHTEDKIKNCITPDEYLEQVKKMLPFSPSFVGACCGSTPLHIKKIKEFLDEKH